MCRKAFFSIVETVNEGAEYAIDANIDRRYAELLDGKSPKINAYTHKTERAHGSQFATNNML